MHKMSVPRMCYGALLLMRLLVKHTMKTVSGRISIRKEWTGESVGG